MRVYARFLRRVEKCSILAIVACNVAFAEIVPQPAGRSRMRRSGAEAAPTTF